jgi:hypothetical protein
MQTTGYMIPEAADLRSFTQLVAESGLPVQAQTLRLWATKGLHGHKLRVRRIGGRLFSTPAALREFLEATESGVAV